MVSPASDLAHPTRPASVMTTVPPPSTLSFAICAVLSIELSTATTISKVTPAGSIEHAVSTDFRQRGSNASSLRAGINTPICQGALLIPGPSGPVESQDAFPSVQERFRSEERRVGKEG